MDKYRIAKGLVCGQCSGNQEKCKKCLKFSLYRHYINMAFAMEKAYREEEYRKSYIYVNQSGDSSVGINGVTLLSIELHDDVATVLQEDNTLAKFESELLALLPKYYEPEFKAYVTDHISQPQA